MDIGAVYSRAERLCLGLWLLLARSYDMFPAKTWLALLALRRTE
jgi:hypothetical protein